MQNKHGWLFPLVLLQLLLAVRLFANEPIQLSVDATEAGKNLLHARLVIPVSPGKLTLFYPKWIPGEHMPSGPINDLIGLEISAHGQPLDWRRDADDMYTFHLDVPAGVDTIEVTLDFILSTGGAFSSGDSATARLLDLNWNQILLYPRTSSPLKLSYAASLRLPAGWKYGTALPVASSVDSHTASANEIQFTPAPLETLIDSPVIAGEFFRTIELTPGKQPAHYLHIVADNESDLEITPEDIGHFQRLVAEANALFGAHHYRNYHFLLTLSDHVAHFGLEHHESSDDRLSEDFLTNPDARQIGADLLPHEMTHSWNGKYRRPAGLATSDYQKPMEDELLWVYEGLTDYYGKVLAARSGLLTATNFEEVFALTAAVLDHRSGRQWRSLADTTIAAPLLYDSPATGISRRRGTDFYPEGDLIWLEADTIIRQQTHGEKSLDNFCKLFHGGQSGPPKVVPYTYDDVINALNQIAPYDWNTFFQKRVYQIDPRAPIGGIENGGWKLVYTNEVPYYLESRETLRKYTDVSYSLGFTANDEGAISDVSPGAPADQAGLAEGMKLVAVNGRGWSAKILRKAIKDAANNHLPIQLLTVVNDYYQTYALDYTGGEKYPVLVRDPAKPDLLDEIIKPLTSH
jgi:predicted metalloprotease with PDZ domain